jgi:hypothetical protein
MSLGSIFTKTYTTYSGVDVSAIFDNIELATLAGIAISVTREKAPVYTFGSANPRSISRGKRGCAGSLMFTLFDRDAFYSLYLDENHYYYAHADEINWLTNPINVAEYAGMFYEQFSGSDNAAVTQGGQLSGLGRNPDGTFSYVDTTQGPPVAGVPVALRGGTTNSPIAQNRMVGARTVRRAAMYADQVMPFDVTLIAQNEYGHASASGVVGVEIINEGGGISMDDITNEQQMTYIAIYRLPWYSLNNGVQKESIYGGVTSLIESNSANGLWTTYTNQQRAEVRGQP